jgi:exonuclease VII small subunit
VPFLAGVAPKLYESATNVRRARSESDRNGRALPPASMELESAVEGQPGRGGGGGLFGGGGGGDDDLYMGGFINDYLPASAASAGFAGEQFMYTVDAPVTIERQRSAMLPILTAAIEGRRVSIYNPTANATNPMRGIELTNDSGLHLMPGPIAVFDAGAYAGDAQIPHTSRNQTRLLSYAVDLPVRCESELTSDSSITRISIDNGMLVQTNKNVRETTYTFENSDERKGRTLLVEHPRFGNWDLITPKEPSEKLSNAYRFEVELDALGEADLRVVEEYVSYSRYDLVQYDLQRLQLMVRRGTASQDVLEAVRTAAQMSATIGELEAMLQAYRNELQEINRDQSRLRDNIKTVREGSDLYQRYLDKLTTQEDRIERINEERDAAEMRLEGVREQLRNYLRNLDVD